jgi:hypothetical protein
MKFNNILKTLKTNSIFLYLASLLFLPIGIIAGVVLCEWEKETGPNFFRFTLTDVLSILVTIGIGIFITFFLSKKTNSDFRKRDIIIDITNRYQQAIENAYSSGCRYMENSNIDTQQNVLASLKMAGIAISPLKRIVNHCEIDTIKESSNQLFEQYRELKKILTDTPFGQPNIKFTPSRRIQFEQHYQTIVSEVYKFKYDLF